MKRKLLLMMSIFLLWGCTNTKQTVQLEENITLSFFYIETCAECKAFKKEAIPYIEKTFGDQVTIHQYDLDDKEKTLKVYDKIIDSLIDFDESKYGMGPFISVDGYFAKLGYTTGDEGELVKDIEKAVKGQTLGYELEAYRFLFKGES